MQSKPKAWLFVISSCLAISGCFAPSPPDIYAFEDLEPFFQIDPATSNLLLEPSPSCMAKIGEPACGHGVAVVSGNDIWVGEATANQYHSKPWSQLKRESVLLPAAESYAPMATYAINACKWMNCNDQVTGFKIKMDSLNGVIPAVQGVPTQ